MAALEVRRRGGRAAARVARGAAAGGAALALEAGRAHEDRPVGYRRVQPQLRPPVARVPEGLLAPWRRPARPGSWDRTLAAFRAGLRAMISPSPTRRPTCSRRFPTGRGRRSSGRRCSSSTTTRTISVSSSWSGGPWALGRRLNAGRRGAPGALGQWSVSVVSCQRLMLAGGAPADSASRVNTPLPAKELAHATYPGPIF